MRPDPKHNTDVLASINITVPESTHIPSSVGTVVLIDGMVGIISAYNPNTEEYEIFTIDSMSWYWFPYNLVEVVAPPSPKSLGILCMFKDSHP